MSQQNVGCYKNVRNNSKVRSPRADSGKKKSLTHILIDANGSYFCKSKGKISLNVRKIWC